MLDLHYVRENLEAVKIALRNRNFPAESLERFAELDAERRRVISEADALNQTRNSSSKEIGALMQTGKRDEAEAKKAEIAGLKDKQSELEKQRDEAEKEMRELLSASAEHSGERRSNRRERSGERRNSENGASRKLSISKSKITLIWAKISAFWIWNAPRKSRVRALRFSTARARN